MPRYDRRPIAVLAAGVILALGASVRPGSPVEAQNAAGTQESLDDLLVSGGVTREQLGGLYRTLAVGQFQPPACVEGEEMFTDVPFDSPFCPWIEELARRGITSGCTATEYCPGNPVSRGQMAVFVVKAMEACPTLDSTDEMIRVGGVCIDKYEASIWDAPVGGNQITEALPCNENGQDCDNIYARSVAGVQPRRSITWFQVQAALGNSGKRLPTNAEWQMAVLGTPDPGASPGSEDCNTSSASPEVTGERANCVSRWGTFDMVGNLWDWVADWDEQALACANWPAQFGSDVTCIGRGSGEASTRFPGALIRGGSFNNGAAGGPFAVIGSAQPSGTFSDVGFRGAR